MRWTLFAVILMFPGLSWGQAGTTFNLPTEGITLNGGAWETPNLNRAACSSTTSIQLTLVLTNGFSAAATDPVLRAWWPASSSTACTGATNGTDDVSLGASPTLTLTDPPLSGTEFVIPDDLTGANSGTPPTLDYSVVMARVAAACDASNPDFVGVDKTTVRLCVGLDSNGDNTVEPGGGLVAMDPHGWVMFTIKTMPPPAPDDPVITPMDKTLSVKLKVSTVCGSACASDDIASYRVVARPKPADPTTAAQAPADWASDSFKEYSGTATAADSVAEISVDGENGITYQVAAYASDSVGNEGPASAVVEGAPQPECDFAECYPTGLVQPGCSGTAHGSGLTALLALVGLARRRSRMESAS